MTVSHADHRPRRYTSQDGLSLFFRDYGDPTHPAVPVLCLPGLTRNSEDFRTLAGILSADGRRVICPDYRGRGLSDHDPAWINYQAPVYLGDIRHLLAVCGVHRTAVIGTSMGGLLTMGMAALMPNAVAAAVLNDVGPDIDQGGVARIIAYIGRDAPQTDWPGAVAYLKTVMQAASAETDDDWLDIAKGSFRHGADGLLHVNWDVTIARALSEGPQSEHDLWALFRALAGRPVLAVRGALSDILSEATFARMERELPGLKRLTVPGVGHTPKLTEPAVTEAIGELLAGL